MATDFLEEDLQKEFAGAAHFWEAIHRLQRLWAGVHPPPPLKKGDMLMLGALLQLSRQNHQPVTSGQLARMMRQSPPGITQKLNALEKQGFVCRSQAEEDRRVFSIELTEQGRQVARDALRQLLGSMENILADFGAEKTQQLVLLLDELADQFEKNAKESEHSQREMM